MVYERGHFGTAKVCGMRNKFIYKLNLDKENEKLDKKNIIQILKNKKNILVNSNQIKQHNENEWLIDTDNKKYIAKKTDKELRFYEKLDELKGSMITIPIAAQRKLGWEKKPTKKEKIDCFSTSKDVILYRTISYEPLKYNLNLSSLSIDWEKLKDDNLRRELLRTIILAPSLQGVYVTLDFKFPDEDYFDKFHDYLEDLQLILPSEMEKLYDLTRFNFTLASEKLCEELYGLINNRENLELLVKERGFIDFYWLLLKELSTECHKQAEIIADALIKVTHNGNKKEMKRSVNRLEVLTKTIRKKIWKNYSYSMNIAFGHRGALLIPHLTIMRSWDGVLKYLKRLVEKLKELDDNDIEEYGVNINDELNKIAQMIKQIVDLSKENLDKNETSQIITLLAELYNEREILQDYYDSIKMQKIMRNIFLILDRLSTIIQQILYISPQHLFSMEKEDYISVENIFKQRRKLFRVNVGNKLISIPREVRKIQDWDELTRLEVFSPSDNTLVYYCKNAKPIHIYYNLSHLPINIKNYPEDVITRVIRDIILVGSIIGPNVKLSLKLPENFRQRQMFRHICRRMREHIEVSDWEDNFANGEFSYEFGLSNITFKDIVADLCKRFENTLTILTNIEKISDIDEKELELLLDYTNESIKYFDKKFSMAINITFARGGLQLSYFYIILRLTLISWTLNSIIKVLKSYLHSKKQSDSSSIINIEESFKTGMNLIRETIDLINPLQNTEDNKSLKILTDGLALHNQLSNFEKPLSKFECKIFENIWRVSDHVVSIAKWWMFLKPVESLSLEVVNIKN